MAAQTEIQLFDSPSMCKICDEIHSLLTQIEIRTEINRNKAVVPVSPSQIDYTCKNGDVKSQRQKEGEEEDISICCTPLYTTVPCTITFFKQCYVMEFFYYRAVYRRKNTTEISKDKKIKIK